MAALLKSAESKDFVGSNPTLSATLIEVPTWPARRGCPRPRRRPLPDSPTGPPPGLCGACRYSRVIQTARGSTFRLCERSTADPRFPRYPTLPVLRCAGFEPTADREP